MILDSYFKRPLTWDYFIAIVLCASGFVLLHKKIILKPKVDECMAIISDVTNISLTMSGFILTLLTVLITFKGSSKITKIEIDSNEPLFDLFFLTAFYHETVSHLKNCIKSLIIIAIIGFTIKIFFSESLKSDIFYFNIIGFTIIILTITRCLLILGKVMELQKENDEKNIL